MTCTILSCPARNTLVSDAVVAKHTSTPKSNHPPKVRPLRPSTSLGAHLVFGLLPGGYPPPVTQRVCRARVFNLFTLRRFTLHFSLSLSLPFFPSIMQNDHDRHVVRMKSPKVRFIARVAVGSESTRENVHSFTNRVVLSRRTRIKSKIACELRANTTRVYTHTCYAIQEFICTYV